MMKMQKVKLLVKKVLLCFLVLSMIVISNVTAEGVREQAHEYSKQNEIIAQSLLEAQQTISHLQEIITILSDEIEEVHESIENQYREIGSTPGYNPRAKYYEVPKGFPKIDPRVRFIGNLTGSWEEMGYQYGERAGDLIVNVYDYAIDFFAERNLDIPVLLEACQKYLFEIESYAPEMIRFMQGISEGASWFLYNAKHEALMEDFEKILLVNVFLDMDFFPPREVHDDDFLSSSICDISLKEHCTGIALSGFDRGDLKSPTKDGLTIVANNCDLAQFVPFGWNCAYVATPDEEGTNVFWSIQPAGLVGGLNLCSNDKGVVIGNFFGGQSEDDSYAFGVPMGVLQTHALAYADSAEEAVDLMVYGNENYREATGRKKVLQTGLWGYIVADREDVMVLELTARRHAIRRPGDLGEVGNYVIYANWYGADHYYDEQNILVHEPIGIHPPEFPERYYTYDWFVKYHFGHIDESLVQEAQKIMYYFDQETGRKIEFLEGSSYPLFLGLHTISSYWGAALGLDIGGTAHAAQVIMYPHGRIKMNWVQGRPSEWVGPWQSTDFFGYQKY